MQIQVGQVVTIHSSQCRVQLTGATRSAIRAFRSATIDKDKTDEEISKSEYTEMTQKAIDELDRLAPLLPQRPSDPR